MATVKVGFLFAHATKLKKYLVEFKMAYTSQKKTCHGSEICI